MESFLKHYHREIVGGLTGLFVAVGFISIGFIKTIFILFFIVIGGLVGHYWPRLLTLLQKD